MIYIFRNQRKNSSCLKRQAKETSRHTLINNRNWKDPGVRIEKPIPTIKTSNNRKIIVLKNFHGHSRKSIIRQFGDFL